MDDHHPEPKKRGVKRVLLLLDWYSRAYHEGAARYARGAGWVLDATAAHAGVAEAIPHWRGDGILAMLHQCRPTAEFCFHSGLPVVDLARQLPEYRFPRVLHDNRAHGRLAADDFLRRGFQHFAFCGYEDAIWSEKERHEGFRSRIEAAGFRVHLLRWGRRHRVRKYIRSRRDELAGALAGLPFPLGVMAHNDDLGVKVINACLDNDLLVPEQVAVTACDNDELVCDFAPVPLSSVDPDLERQAYEGSALLDQLMRGARPPGQPRRTPPRGLVVRQSSDMLAVDHLEVAKALQFIWRFATDPQLGVDAIVAATSLSKTGLNHAFQRYLKRSIGAELRRFRLEKAMVLLKSSPASIAAVACACGYSNDKHLRNNLHRATGQSPSVWRKAATIE
jgi:LacI family transcriptional regulator